LTSEAKLVEGINEGICCRDYRIMARLSSLRQGYRRIHAYPAIEDRDPENYLRNVNRRAS